MNTTVDWNDVASAWGARRQQIVRDKAPTRAALLAAAALQPGQRVLELGCGTGDVARLLADQVGPAGSVLATDIAEDMVAIARGTLADLPQAEACRADLIDTGLPEASVDVVVSCMSLMFAPEPEVGLQEARRVLRPGGRLAVAVWAAPQHNPWITSVGMSAMLHGLVEGGPPVGPGQVFSLGDPEVLQRLSEDAGFTDVVVQVVDNPFAVASADEHIDRVFALTPVLADALDRADEPTRAAVRRTATEAVERYRTDDGLVLPGRALVLSGVRPEVS
ncbi:MAG TPA: methyltransferase domain-containing protein [Mycobacteriales bacterium]|nr:methyltransferase domain-containing protein [Mycobacteriales bacterium]